MKKIIDNLIGKRPIAVLIDGKVLDQGKSNINLNIAKSWQPYIVTDNEAMAMKYFENEKIRVIQANYNTARVSTHWAGLTICSPKNMAEFSFYVDMVSPNNGIFVYLFENLFDINNEDEARNHEERCRSIYGLENMNLIQEDGRQYLIAIRKHSAYFTSTNFEHFLSLFYGPIIDSSITSVKYSFKNFGWSHPKRFLEKDIPDWKHQFFFKNQSITESFFSEAVKPKFLGGTIEEPNYEQTVVLLASGAIDKEVTLEDGRIVVLKGTEELDIKTRIKFDIEGEPKALVEQQVRNTLIYGLDMTNGKFFKLSTAA